MDRPDGDIRDPFTPSAISRNEARELRLEEERSIAKEDHPIADMAGTIITEIGTAVVLKPETPAARPSSAVGARTLSIEAGDGATVLRTDRKISLTPDKIPYNSGLPDVAPKQSRTFTTKDPGVGPLIEAIEKRFPGTVQQAEVGIYRPDGTLYTDFDIVTDTHVIQVKIGGGKGIVPQIRTSQALTDHQVVGFDANELVGTGQKFKASVLRSARDNGITIYNNVESLLQALEKK